MLPLLQYRISFPFPPTSTKKYLPEAVISSFRVVECVPVLHNVFTSEVRLVSAKTHACHPGKVETHLAGMSVVVAKRGKERGWGRGRRRKGEGKRGDGGKGGGGKERER